ncbi:MAG: FecR family protein [Verrucomicrobiota bacterium]
MTPPESTTELLVRLLDGRLPEAERTRLEERLRRDPDARAQLRDLAEQSVRVADRERSLAARQAVAPPRPAPPRRRFIAGRPWSWGLAGALAAAALVLGTGWASGWLRPARPPIARLTKVTGASQVFGSRGHVEYAPTPGQLLHPGDTLETASCDAWVELTLRDGTRLTLAGHSVLRFLESGRHQLRLSLLRGNLWGESAAARSSPPLTVQTPAARIEASAQFDLQASLARTTLRVNAGAARLVRTADEQAVEVAPGRQAVSASDAGTPLVAIAQPQPVSAWAPGPGRLPEVVLGEWLPPTPAHPRRLGAAPLLWPVPGRDPVTLYVVGLSVRRSSDRPVQLSPGATVVCRGRTASPQTVRFGFSTQRMQGIFAGKFEVDLPPSRLGMAGGTWTVRLPLSAFQPLQPQLSARPAGLELNDLYALTVGRDAGLEVHEFHIEDGPAPEP